MPDTGWLDPTDEYGVWDKPTWAYTSDDKRAEGEESDEEQDYYEYGVSVPEGKEITEVLIRIEHYETGSNERLAFRVSKHSTACYSLGVGNWLLHRDTETIDEVDITHQQAWTPANIVNFCVRIKTRKTGGGEPDLICPDWSAGINPGFIDLVFKRFYKQYGLSKPHVDPLLSIHVENLGIFHYSIAKMLSHDPTDFDIAEKYALACVEGRTLITESGGGGKTAFLQKLGFNIKGLTIGEEVQKISLGRNLNIRKLRFENMPSETYDTIIVPDHMFQKRCRNILHMEALLSKARKMLSPKGKLIITGFYLNPAIIQAREYIEKYGADFLRYRHEWRNNHDLWNTMFMLTPDNMRKLLVKVGLKPIEFFSSEINRGFYVYVGEKI